MSLLDYTTINCTLPALQLGFCCLAAGGTWLSDAGGWCQFRPATRYTLGDYIRTWSSSWPTMRDSLRTWNECASRAASANTTLAGLLEASGPLCVPAHGAQKLTPPDYTISFVCIGVLLMVYLCGRQEQVDKLRREMRELRKELCEAGVKISPKYRPSKQHSVRPGHQVPTKVQANGTVGVPVQRHGHDSERGQCQDPAVEVDEKEPLISLV